MISYQPLQKLPYVVRIFYKAEKAMKRSDTSLSTLAEGPTSF